MMAARGVVWHEKAFDTSMACGNLRFQNNTIVVTTDVRIAYSVPAL